MSLTVIGIYGAAYSAGPVLGVAGAKYLGYSPLAGAAAGAIATYAYFSSPRMISVVSAGAGAVYLPQILPFGDGILGSAIGAFIGATGSVLASIYLMKPGTTDISTPSA